MTIGIGIKLTNPNLKTVGQVKQAPQLIAESIHRILNTSPGERVRDPNFGCRINEMLFETNEFAVATLGAFHINEAITKYEPRVNIKTISPVINEAGNTITVSITFTLLTDPNQLFITSTEISNG